MVVWEFLGSCVGFLFDFGRILGGFFRDFWDLCQWMCVGVQWMRVFRSYCCILLLDFFCEGDFLRGLWILVLSWCSRCCEVGSFLWEAVSCVKLPLGIVVGRAGSVREVFQLRKEAQALG